MKTKFLLVLTLLILGQLLYGQKTNKIESQIRNLEQKVVVAIINADTTALEDLWAPEFLVNSPRNTITESKDSVLLLQKAGMIDYSSFERIIERFQFQKDLVITMGYEYFVSKRDIPLVKAGQTYKRRFTNIWMKKKGKWQQIARHASIICQ